MQPCRRELARPSIIQPCAARASEQGAQTSPADCPRRTATYLAHHQDLTISSTRRPVVVTAATPRRKFPDFAAEITNADPPLAFMPIPRSARNDPKGLP